MDLDRDIGIVKINCILKKICRIDLKICREGRDN